MKRIASVALAVIICLGIAISAMAAQVRESDGRFVIMAAYQSTVTFDRAPIAQAPKEDAPWATLYDVALGTHMLLELDYDDYEFMWLFWEAGIGDMSIDDVAERWQNAQQWNTMHRHTAYFVFDTPGIWYVDGNKEGGFYVNVVADNGAEDEGGSDSGIGSGIGILIDGNAIAMDVAPFIQDGRTFVPLRAIGEAFGDVDWNQETSTASVTLPDGTIIAMTIGEYDIAVTCPAGNETIITNDAAPVIVDGRTMLPVRGLAEAAGFSVDWNQESQTVLITS